MCYCNVYYQYTGSFTRLHSKLYYFKIALYYTIRVYTVCVYTGTRVYNGDAVLFFPWVMGRQEELWTDALKFDPNRCVLLQLCTIIYSAYYTYSIIHAYMCCYTILMYIYLVLYIFTSTENVYLYCVLYCHTVYVTIYLFYMHICNRFLGQSVPSNYVYTAFQVRRVRIMTLMCMPCCRLTYTSLTHILIYACGAYTLLTYTYIGTLCVLHIHRPAPASASASTSR